MDDFLKLKNKRSTYRTQLTKLFTKIETVLKDQDSELETLESELELLLSKDCTVKELNSEIEKCLRPEEIETEINKCSEYEEKVILYKTKLRKRIKQLQPDSDQNNSGNNSTLNSSEETSIRVTETKTVKLPKLMISKYYGEPDKYLDFMNQYENAIHNNPSLTDIDKFNYLKSLLGGIAANAISGFSLTGKNYAAAITLLKQRFGNHDMLIHAHLNNLLNISPIKSISDIHGLRNLYDKCETQIRSLEALGVAENTYSCLLCPILLKLLPCELTLEFTRIQDNDKKLDVQTLLNFLRNEVESREKVFQIHKSEIKSIEMKPQKTFGRINERYKRNINSSFSRAPARPGIASVTELLTSTNDDSCLFCRKAHRSENCDSFNVNDRKNFCKRHWFCFLCMKPKHRVQECVRKDSFSCSYCNGLHNIALCFKRENEKRETLKSSKIDNTVTKHVSKSDNSATKHVNTEQNKIDCTVSNHVNNEQNKILLQTAAVKLVGKLSSKVIRSLYDPGSQRSFIRKDLSRQLSLNKVGEEELFIHTFGSKAPTRIKCDRVQVKIRDILDKDEVIIEALEIDEVSSAPLEFAPIDVITELKTEGINLCDVNYGILGSENISLLIGADHYFNIVSGKIKRLNPKLVAIESKFGWLLMGEVEGRNSSNRNVTSAMSTISLFVSGSSIENLWKLDTLGIRDPVEVQSRKETEIEVLNYFKKTVTVNNEGRYEVHLPWVADQIILNSNEDICKERLKSVTNKLLQKNKLEDYGAVFGEWIEDEVIEEVPFNEIEKKSHYLPHRGVFKESSTTKVRPVFDASCRGKNSLSLNDCLEKGPNLLEEIPPILLRFRKEKIGVVSDIKRAFLQISIFKPDCEFLRFLWWDNLKEESVKIFRHKRLVFGLNCSPFILGAVLNYHLEKNFEKYPETVSRLMKSFYVDNCVTSVPDDDTLHRFMEESKHILATACFDLRGWEHTSFNIDPDPSDPIPVLGLLWNKDDDNIFCDTEALKCPSTNLTRRNILSIIHKIFDPLGILCPATLIPKLLIQKSWNLKIGWDTVLPDDYQREFSSWLRDVNCLSDMKIPRCLNINTLEGLSLHVFCDASKTAYSTVIFLRKFKRDTISVSFVSAKSRVAPLRKTTIPRLELLGCCIGARLSAVVIKALNLGDIPIYYWTDSSTALFWIEKDENWGVFVKNRVQEIKSLTKNGIWRHVPGNLNAADLPSRGCSISTLFKSRWWEGPDWLKRSEEEWPKSDVVLNDEEIQKEKRKTVASHLTVTKEKWYLKYFFSYFKIVRMTSWILRFIRNCRQPQEKMKGSLTIQEIDEAERKLLKIVQDESFSEEGNLKGLLTYVDQDGLYRLKTKIIRREDTEDFRCPIVLPSNDELVHRLIFDHHLKLSHAGVQFVLTHLRQRFWILRGRKTVQRVLSKCILCKRHTARAVETLPSALPEDRIREASAFEVTGVDVAGPLHLKTAKKAWILIFTCAVYRAVHLELIESLSTNGFLLGLRRFIARRGRPSMIYSDNGSNFVGANRLLKAIDWNQISNFSSEMRIQWKFNPPTASWWGGWWERLIQTVKKLLRRVLGKACLTFEEMSTILCDVEAVINSRPLTYLSEDPTDLEPLTPLLFIQDIKTVGVPDIDKLDKINLTKRWRYHQRLREQFRKRFRDEYLGLLVQKPLKRKFVRPIEINDIVLVGQENLKRSDWPIGRVMDIYPGKDNQVRVVKVKTKAGELTRPVKKLYPLELSSLT